MVVDMDMSDDDLEDIFRGLLILVFYFLSDLFIKKKIIFWIIAERI